MAIDTGMTAATLTAAKQHVYNVCSTGSTITLIKPGTKDEFGTLLTESTLSFTSFPIRYSPFDRDVVRRIAWAEKVDVIFYISKRAADIANKTIDALKQYKSIKHSGHKYTISYVEPYSHFYSDYLYVVIGASK